MVSGLLKRLFVDEEYERIGRIRRIGETNGPHKLVVAVGVDRKIYRWFDAKPEVKQGDSVIINYYRRLYCPVECVMGGTNTTYVNFIFPNLLPTVRKL